MKRKHLQLLFILALALPLFTSCRDDKEFIAPSNTEILVAHEWKGDQALMMGINISGSGTTQQGIPDVRTIRLTFNRDNTYIAKTGDGTISEGKWRFNEDETKLYFDFLGFEEFNVKKLTDENLNLSTNISVSQLTLLAQTLPIDAEIPSIFSSLTEIEAEVMFVKP